MNTRFIDTHVHLFNLYDGQGGNCLDSLDQYQKDLGAEAINLLSIPLNVGEMYDVRQNILFALYKLRNPSAYAYGGLTYPEVPIRGAIEGMEPLTQYKQLMQIGFDGIKMLESRTRHTKQLKMPINSPYYEDFLAQAEKDGTHMNWHVASPRSYWDPANKEKVGDQFYGGGDFAAWEEIIGWVHDVLKRHPRLNVTFAHFFFHADRTEELARLFDTYENVGVDLCPGGEMYVEFKKDMPYFRAFLEKYADRILFGTDASFPAPVAETVNNSKNIYRAIASSGEVCRFYELQDFLGLGLCPEALEKICYTNFRRLHPQPKPIDVDALKRYTKIYAPYIRNEAERRDIVRMVEEL